MDLGSDPTHSSTTSSSTARSSSSHVFTIPESTNIFHEIFLCFVFLKGKSFLCIEIKYAGINVYHNRKRHFADL